jgi:hypothetical protein
MPVLISSHILAITGPASGVLLLVFGFLALLVVDVLIALIEGVTLTLLSWNPFRQSLFISLIMNLVSGIINGILLILLQHTPLIWLPISFALSLAIEWFVMTYFKRQAARQNGLYVVLVNLASYILLILPAYYFGSR